MVSIAMSFGFTVFVLVYVAAAFSGKLLLLLLLLPHLVLIACSMALMWCILLFSCDQQSLQKPVPTQFNLAEFNLVTIVLHVMLACFVKEQQSWFVIYIVILLACNVENCVSVMRYACVSEVTYEAAAW